jgi:hypothetical protein
MIKSWSLRRGHWHIGWHGFSLHEGEYPNVLIWWKPWEFYLALGPNHRWYKFKRCLPIPGIK